MEAAEKSPSFQWKARDCGSPTSRPPAAANRMRSPSMETWSTCSMWAAAATWWDSALATGISRGSQARPVSLPPTIPRLHPSLSVPMANSWSSPNVPRTTWMFFACRRTARCRRLSSTKTQLRGPLPSRSLAAAPLWFRKPGPQAETMLPRSRRTRSRPTGHSVPSASAFRLWATQIAGMW